MIARANVHSARAHRRRRREIARAAPMAPALGRSPAVREVQRVVSEREGRCLVSPGSERVLSVFVKVASLPMGVGRRNTVRTIDRGLRAQAQPTIGRGAAGNHPCALGQVDRVVARVPRLLVRRVRGSAQAWVGPNHGPTRATGHGVGDPGSRLAVDPGRSNRAHAPGTPPVQNGKVRENARSVRGRSRRNSAAPRPNDRSQRATARRQDAGRVWRSRLRLSRRRPSYGRPLDGRATPFCRRWRFRR